MDLTASKSGRANRRWNETTEINLEATVKPLVDEKTQVVRKHAKLSQ
ncbi:hypothetical protein ACX15B_27625 (plasmid) [Vibrio harveyi]